MSEENVVGESTPQEAVETTEQSVTEESQPQEQQPDVKSDSSPEEAESVVDAVLNELNDEEPEQIPDETPESKQEAEVQDEQKQSEVSQEDKATEAPDEETAEATEANPTDDEYSEPEGLKPKAQERFRSLVEANKAKDRELEESRQTISEIQKTIKETGISSEEFGGLLDFARMANSQSYDDKQKAFQIVKGEMQRLAKEIGIEEGGVDLLAEFKDLSEKVENYELDRSDAIEIANARRSQKRQTEQQNLQQKQMEQTQNQKAEVEKSTQTITDFMNNRQKTDIDFVAKEKYLMGQVENIQRNYPPSQWPSVVEQLYDALGSMSSNQVQQEKLKASSPIQSSGQSVGATQPGSMADAILSELS